MTKPHTVSEGRTIRDAVRVALEALPGNLMQWAQLDQVAMRDHVRDWVKGYARARGVLLTDVDIDSELNQVIGDLHSRTTTPVGVVILVAKPCGTCAACRRGDTCTARSGK